MNAREPVRVARIISRLNVGGPAIQAVTLTARMEPLGYRTTLIRGRERPHEGSMDFLAQELGAHPLRLASLRRDPGPHDLPALASLVRQLRRVRPHIVHTHTAKAGALGRAAALLAFPPGRRPVLAHTYHGHSLAGYFSGPRSAAFTRVETALARRTDRLIAVSDEVRRELVALGVAPRESLEVVRLGFDLAGFVVDGDARERRRAAVRARLEVPSGARVVTLVARLVAIKRVDRFLRVAARLAGETDVRFLIVGDGELRDQLRARPEARALGDRIAWTGLRRDMPDVYFASDVVVQTSDSEGTPVALIEAQAAGLPVVSTSVGGVASVVADGESGRVAPADDEAALAGAVREILADPAGARAMSERGRRHALEHFSLDRLLAEHDDLYRRLLRARMHAP